MFVQIQIETSSKMFTQDILQGGLKMVNIEKYVDAIKLTWLKRLTTGDFGKWKVIPQHLFDKCGKNFLIFHMNTNSIKALPAFPFRILS